MKYLKLIAGVIGGFILLVGLSYRIWYTYPSPKLSFFLSGQGEPFVDILYKNSAGDENTTMLYPVLSSEPQLQELLLDEHKIKEINVIIKHYQGTLHLSDVFLNGRNLKNPQALPSDNLNILNASANNLSFIMQNETTIHLCDDCLIISKKQFMPNRFFLLCMAYFIALCVFLATYLFRAKLKEKMLKIYTLKNYAKIFPYAKPYWFRALLAVIITIPVGSMDAVIAWSLKPFMDVVLVEQQTGWTMYIPLMIIIFSILQAVFTYISTYLNTWVGNKIAFDVKRQLYNKLLHSDAATFDNSNSGDILFRYNNDAEAACSGLLNNMKLFTTRFFSSLSLIIVLFYNSWKLAIIAVVVLFGALYPLTLTRKRLKKVVSNDANAIASLYMRYNETFSGNRIITAYNLFDFCRKKFVCAIDNIFDLSIQMVTKTAIIAPAMHVISSFGIAFVIWYGSHLIVTHQITVGNFASFITSLVMLYNPIKSIGNNYNGVIFSLIAVERVFEKLNLIPNVKNCEQPQILKSCAGNIVYQDVSFEYIKNKPILKHINLTIKNGQTIALVGNSGGGKTTISSLLPRFYDVTGGKILLDGINIKNIDIDNLRSHIAIVFQDNFLFGGTIRENILFGRQNVSEDQLHQAIKSACLEEFIASLDCGLDTQIGERGVMLSGGQKQRIAIARAFIKNAPILILDEATSALDNKSEAIVQHAIDNLMKDRTVLVIAHRLSTIRHADKIVVINNGEIAEIGSHEELLEKEGIYASLYATQLV